MLNTQFTPGQIWLDSDGVPINAHGGCVILHEGVYYWYGEHKIAGPMGNTAQIGISVYTSHDLYNWTNAGIALPVSESPDSEICKGCIIERPKVIYNERDARFVMWFHLEYASDYGTARSGVAISDTPLGPFTFTHSLRPNSQVWPRNTDPAERRELTDAENLALRGFEFNGGHLHDYPADRIFRRDYRSGQMARDMTLFQEEDGRAYQIYSSEENGTLHISELSADYLDHQGDYIRVFPGGFHEAPTMIKHSGRYYLITSGCTSWDPNAARSSVADSIWGPWHELGNPCIGTAQEQETTFHSQGTFIFNAGPESERTIFMADRWCPSNPIDGRYVWLPLEFEPDRVTLRWRRRWSL